MLYKIKKIYNPEIFQGQGKSTNYFEGWYFKLVDKGKSNVIAVIPGISISNKKKDSHSFIQVSNGNDGTVKYFKFDFFDFKYSTNKFEIRIGKNIFSSSQLILNIVNDCTQIIADLKFFNIKLWPKSLLSPGAMGWYAFVPIMECYHAVLSMHHEIKGYVNFGASDIDFTGGRGYIEKDWGVSFPKGWIWLQTNHFTTNYLVEESRSIMLSIARIPWRGKYFTGFICGFLNNNKFYIFATYNGSKIKKLQYSNRDVHVVLESKKFEITVLANRQNSAMLLSPIMGAMDGRITESLDATIKVILRKKNVRGNSELVFDSKGCCGGLEIVNPEVLE